MDRARIRAAVGQRVAPALAVARTLETFDRPAWLYRLRNVPSSGEPLFRAPRPVSAADLELCRRLIDAHRLARSTAPPPSGMWAHGIFEERQRELEGALRGGSPAILAELLASMFRSDFVLGMAPGSLGREWPRGPLARLAWLGSMNKLVALAEAIGSTRVENPEQGPTGAALRIGGEALIAGIEQRLGGISLDFPDVGAAYGLLVGGRLISPESPDQIYGAARLRSVIATHLPATSEPPRIVEIGGGYGGMAYWLLRMLDARYVIVDLPIVCAIQGYFLSQALGHSAVALHGEPPAAVTILPAHALGAVQTPCDIVVNKDSLPEIPRQSAVAYLEWARSACRGVLYSYNQEGAAVFDGTPQNVVCELVEEVGGFTRVRRDASWLRRGYVEEIFTPSAIG
jgi:hypothetical protein